MDSSCLEMTLKSGLDKTRSNSLRTKGCGESKQIESFGALERLVATFLRVGKTGRTGKELWGRCSRVVTDGLGEFHTSQTAEFRPPEATWEYVDRLKKITKMKVLLKGLDSGDDAKLAVEHGADGIIVSNHGGRATETPRATVDCVPEVVQAVNGRVPVVLDSGVRRGTDVFKALALGAAAVSIGRPYVWGLALDGQAGVEHVLRCLLAEIDLTLALSGYTSVSQVDASALAPDPNYG